MAGNQFGFIYEDDTELRELYEDILQRTIFWYL